ncbi:hypothetical protein [Comamonas thiooxydans]|uniref:hypothetical protein n=1 Tax=Comamonas thiooxydans TaxID=363952 RepID=UPI001E598649|nr:hypothetical protein [Comamonas thiooxydans]
MKKISNQGMVQLALSVVTAAVLTACGGGGGGGSSEAPASNSASASGVAAVGSPITGGAVTLKCASGASASATTGTDGSWSASLKSSDFPCVIRVSGGQANAQALTTPLHSMVAAAGLANITPLTDLLVGIVSGQKPDTWFDSATNGSLSGAIHASALATAQDKLKAVLSSLPGKPSLPAGFDPLTSQFHAQKGDAGDDLLESYGAALTSAGLTQSEAAGSVAAGETLTQAAFAGTAFTTPNMTLFRAGAAKTKAGDFVLSMPDPQRGLLTSKAGLDMDGNVTQVGLPFVAVASLLGNRIAQYCTQGAGAFGSNQHGQYAYLSEDWTPVTNTSELHGKVFNEYEDCSSTGTLEFRADDSVVFTENGGVPDAPNFGFSKALSGEGMEDPAENSITHAKVYKITLDGKTTYAYVGVSTQKGLTTPVIDGKANYVTMGISQ